MDPYEAQRRGPLSRARFLMYNLVKRNMPSKLPVDWAKRTGPGLPNRPGPELSKRTGLKRHWSFMQEIFVLFFAVRDLRTPLYVKFTAFLALAYLLSPLDFIPDFIPVAGWLDDLVIVPLVLHLSFRLLPAEVREDSWIKARKQASRVRIILFLLVLLLLALLTGIFFLVRSAIHHL